jgi:hypothetical protein
MIIMPCFQFHAFTARPDDPRPTPGMDGESFSVIKYAEVQTHTPVASDSARTGSSMNWLINDELRKRPHDRDYLRHA